MHFWEKIKMVLVFYWYSKEVRKVMIAADLACYVHKKDKKDIPWYNVQCTTSSVSSEPPKQRQTVCEDRTDHTYSSINWISHDQFRRERNSHAENDVERWSTRYVSLFIYLLVFTIKIFFTSSIHISFTFILCSGGIDFNSPSSKYKERKSY